MLPKHSRLTKQTIEKSLIRARRIKTPRFLVMYATIPGAQAPQVSITVSKKVAPKAVLRNMLRRRGYAALMPLIPSLSPTVAVLISYTTPDRVIPIPTLTKEFEELFMKAGVYSKS